MRYDKHLFISYSHIDNQPLTPHQQGWISRFHDSMAALLSMRIGRKAEIWRDDKLRGNDIFGNEIVEQFSQTAMLISVVTPRYLESEWCTREVREFCTRADQSGGVALGNKARIFKILKEPVDTQDSLPAVVKGLLGYEFFIYEDGAPLELDPAYGDKFGQDYNRKVGKLAWDVAQMLKSMEATAGAGPEAGGKPATAKAAAVYLAECSHDRRDFREMLEADLRLHGYSVLPDQRLPLDEAEYTAAVERLLAGCVLSVHLVGSAYGAVPDGPSQKSTPVLQNELAARLSRKAGLQRVIWLPDGTRSDHTMQQAFLGALHQDADAQCGADLLTGDFEELKTAIHTALKKKTAEPRVDAPAQGSAAKGPRCVHIICDERDRKATIPLRKFLRDRSIEVSLPAFEGNAAAVREANQKLLSACDAVLVFYGAGDEAWKRTNDNEFRKMQGLRGGAEPLPAYTYLAEPRTSDKQDLVDMQERCLIDGLTAFPEAELAALVKLLSPPEGSS